MRDDNDNTGLVWKTEDASYFLRDDTALGLYGYDEQQTYSLFRKHPGYQRVEVFTSDYLDWVLLRAGEAVTADIVARDGVYVDASTIFLDEMA
jgi:hypothetical protein